MLNWRLRPYVKELRDEGRLALLVVFILHANIRLRCWPSSPLLVEETGWASESVAAAKKWLLARGAVALVPYRYRVDEELDLPKAQHVYQLTGAMLIDDKPVPYLYMTPEAERAIQGVLSNISLGEISPTEISPSENKGIPSSKDDSILKDEDSAADAAPAQTPSDVASNKATPSPHIAIIDAYHQALPDDVRPPEQNYSRNVAAARKLRDAGHTPDQVAAFVTATYPTYRKWARKRDVPELMSLEHVATYIKSFLAREDDRARNQSSTERAAAAAVERQRQLAERFDLND